MPSPIRALVQIPGSPEEPLLLAWPRRGSEHRSGEPSGCPCRSGPATCGSGASAVSATRGSAASVGPLSAYVVGAMRPSSEERLASQSLRQSPSPGPPSPAASSIERSASPELRPVEGRTARPPVRGPCAVRPPTAAVVAPALRSPRREQLRRSPVVVWTPKSPGPTAFIKPSGREVDIPTATRIGDTCAAQAGFQTPTRPCEGDSEKRRLGFGLTPVRQMPTLLANLHASGSPCMSKPEGQK
mmetsp:Transcript_73903/g.208334  ORF Transcript_73903/g.208334 Transcript_73903/m.208334 type:complete len:243 (+) Transcript_73903:3-731(+)